jgi:hypothetical protein
MFHRFIYFYRCIKFLYFMKNPVKYPVIILSGFLFGILVILPVNEFASFYQYHRDEGVTVWQFMGAQFWKVVTLQMPVKLLFYLLIGGIMGVLLALVTAYFRRRNKLLFQLSQELEKDITQLIAQGEGEDLEFKSSFRYDYRQQKVNKALESVIIKTISGFLNARGGSLLIGVADDGSIPGLEEDYKTLNRKDSDGYTQMLMSTIADKLGTPVCRLIRILFYRHQDKEICRIIVLPSPIPVYTREDQEVRFYIRTASGTRDMDIREAVSFIRAKWG